MCLSNFSYKQVHNTRHEFNSFVMAFNEHILEKCSSTKLQERKKKETIVEFLSIGPRYEPITHTVLYSLSIHKVAQEKS